MNISERLSQIEFKLLNEENDKSVSLSGRNAYYHHCDVYNGRASYCVCLHTIAAVGAGRVTLASGCQDAITKKNCPALFMRAKEIKEGKALYFIDRLKFEEEREKVYDEYYSNQSYGYGKLRASTSPLKGKWVEDKMDYTHVHNSKSVTVQKKANSFINMDVSVNDDALTSAINNKVQELNNE